ncbi:MAG: CapA family protein [Eubacteriales bacterium]
MRIAFLGDIAIMNIDLLKQFNTKRFNEIESLLGNCNYVIGNLETPITNKKNTLVPKSMHIKTTKGSLPYLKKLHIDAVSLANNHMYDYGKKGYLDTLAALNEANIKFFGVNNEKCSFEDNENKIRIRGYCCYSTNGFGYSEKHGINPLVKSKIINNVKSDLIEGYLPIISLHWGTEFTHYPSEEQVELAHEVAKQGICIICGHHPHIIQGLEIVDKSLIAYSLGNFYFDECTSPFVKGFDIKQGLTDRKSYILIVNIENNTIIDFETFGIYSNEYTTEIIDINNELDSISHKIKNYKEYSYEFLRKDEIQKARIRKFGKRNIKWLICKLNYYSIMSRVITYVNRYRKGKAYK